MENVAGKTYAVDRIEGGLAICECLQTGARITVDKRHLPPKVREGDILRQSGQGFVADEALRKQRQEYLTDKMNKLFEKHK